MSKLSTISGAVTTLGTSSSLSAVVSAGIIGLLVQGLETGLVVTQLSSWLSVPEWTESRFVIILTVFVTTVGFLQTGISVASSWRIFVEQSGQPVIIAWTEIIQTLLTTTMAVPVQSLLIWRCYHILRGNIYIIVLLVSLLLGSIVASILVTVGLFLPSILGGPSINSSTVWPPFLLYSAFPTSLDIAISCILLHYLTRIRKQVYAEQKRQRITYLVNIVWQSAVPPTLFTAAFALSYTISLHSHSVRLILWYPTLQAMTGKLYVLSLFYNLNVRTLFVGERPTDGPYITSLTVPTFNGMGIAGDNVHDA